MILACLELSGLYQQPFLLEAGKRLRGRFAGIGEAFPQAPELARHSPLYWAAVHILGSAALNLIPLFLAGYVSGAGARFIDDRIEWPRSAHLEQAWFPFIMTLVLLPARCYQFHLILKPLGRGFERGRKVVFSLVIVLYLLIAVFRYRADPTYHFAYSLFPEDAYSGFLFLEIALLLFLIPATWMILGFPRAERTRGQRSTRTASAV